jgi:predicted ATPase
LSWGSRAVRLGSVRSDAALIRTPDQRLRVFVSSTLGELAEERLAVRRAVERLHLVPVMFEMGARPHPPRELYRAYLEQSHVFVGVYWQRYGWVAPGEEVSGLEDEFRLADGLPQLLYIKHPAPEREPGLSDLLLRVQERDQASYRRFSTLEELEQMVAHDLAVLLSERFAADEGHVGTRAPAGTGIRAPLPDPLTRTIGRDGDVAEVLGLIDDGHRLVTVTGPGGVGKTRLAVEVGRVLAARPGVEVHYVPLAAVTSARLVPGAIADRIGVRRESGGSPLDALVEHFAGRPGVLLLDNLEQVVSVGPDLARLLELASGLTVLATSRQALRVVGEHEFSLRPLEVPDESAGPSEVELAPSVALLLERARARGVPLELTAETAPAVAQLCRRLAGLPLAIELVVPRLRLLGPRAVLDRLGSALDLPEGGDDLPSRQRSLRAALEWSHDLLDEQERRLLAELSVFAGGATVEAVESVCSLDARSVETALAGLLDKSLVHVGGSAADAELRITMLEPVRDFAREQLEALGGLEDALRRHLAYFAGLGRRAQPFLCGPRQREWASRFDAERANVRVAMATALDSGSLDTVLRLTWDTMVYYYIRDAVEESRTWLKQVACADGRLDQPERALLDAGLFIVGDPPSDPERLLSTATEVFDSADLPLEAAVSRHHLGLHHWWTGRRVEAVVCLEEASRRYTAIGHDWGVAMMEMTLGAALATGGDRARAREHLEEALARATRIANRPQLAQTLQGLALVAALDARPTEALEFLHRAAELVLADHSVTGATYCLEALAAIAIERGETADAVRLVGCARGTRSRRMIPEWTAAADAADPVLDAARRALSPEMFAEEWGAGFEMESDVLALLAEGLAAEESGVGADTLLSSAE